MVLKIGSLVLSQCFMKICYICIWNFRKILNNVRQTDVSFVKIGSINCISCLISIVIPKNENSIKHMYLFCNSSKFYIRNSSIYIYVYIQRLSDMNSCLRSSWESIPFEAPLSRKSPRSQTRFSVGRFSITNFLKTD